MKPVKINISCGNRSAEIVVRTERDGIGIDFETTDIDSDVESCAVYNISTLCLVGLGIPQEEVDGKIMGLN